MNLSLHTSIARRAAMALAASGHTTSGSGGGLLWHHHHDDEILYCCRRFFRLIKPSRDWRAGVPKCAPETVSCCYGWCCLLLVLLFNLDHSKNSLDRLSVHLIVSHQMIRLLVNGDGMEAEWWGFIHTQIVMMISGAPRKYPGMGIINIVSTNTYILTYSFFFKGSQKHVKLLYKRRSFNMWVFLSNAIVVPFA